LSRSFEGEGLPAVRRKNGETLAMLLPPFQAVGGLFGFLLWHFNEQRIGTPWKTRHSNVAAESSCVHR